MRHAPFFIHLRLLLVGLHLLSGALQVVLLFPLGDDSRRQCLKRAWSRRLLALLGIRVETATTPLLRIRDGLLVCNHISFIDIFVINALLPSGFVAKSDVLQWPLVGWLCRHNTTVFIERGSRRAAHLAHRNMLHAFGAGKRLAIFPEGTTTNGDRLLPFHAALFQSAIDAAVPVHALALSYHGTDGLRSRAPAYIDDLSLVACIKTVLRTPGLVAHLTLADSFVPPLPDRRHLAHHAHQAIAARLGHPQRGNTSQPLGNEAAIRT